MVEPLFVDTARLEAAANVLRDALLPAPPAPLTVGGTDQVSSAVNDTLVAIETPVLRGLPIAGADLRATASSMAVAAAAYAETDSAYGGHVALDTLSTAPRGVPDGGVSSREPTATSLGATSLGATATTNEPPARPGGDDAAGRAVDRAQQWNQLAQASTGVTTFAQTVASTVQGAAQNAPAAESTASEDDESETEHDATTEAGERPPTDGPLAQADAVGRRTPA